MRAVLLVWIAAAGLAHAAALVHDCSALNGTDQQQCINSWVELLRAAEGLKPCTGDTQQCINAWVNFKFLLSRCGLIIADCDCFTQFPLPGEDYPTRIQKCINSWVLDKQTAGAGTVCAAKATAKDEQACLNQWANDKKMTEDDLPTGMVGSSCFSRPPNVHQACIDDWVNKKICQRKGKNSATCGASCTTKHSTPEGRRQCVNDWLQGHQWLMLVWGPNLLPGRYCSKLPATSNATKPLVSRCTNAYLFSHAVINEYNPFRDTSAQDQFVCRAAFQQYGKLADGQLRRCVNGYVNFLYKEKKEDYPLLVKCFENGLGGKAQQQCVNTFAHRQHRLDYWWLYPSPASWY